MRLNRIKMHLVNALDVAIILVVAAVVISAFFKIHNKQIFMVFDKSHKAVVTLSINNESLDSSDIKYGEIIYSNDDLELGKVISVKNIKEKKYTAINSTIMVDYSEKNVGVLIEIETKIKENSSKKYINGSLFVAPGTVISVYGEAFDATDAVIEEIVMK